MTNEGFSARLQRILDEKGWSPSELARQIFGEKLEKRTAKAGYEYETTVAKNRQVVSKWVKGETIPQQKHRVMLASALNCSVEDLIPHAPQNGWVMGAVGDDGKVEVNLSARLPAHTAQTVYDIIKGHLR